MIKELEKIYPMGSDITVMNTFYQYAIREKDTRHKICDDFIYITYKDNMTGKKNMIKIDKPTYIYYISKPDQSVDYSRLFIEKDKVDSVEVPFSKLYQDIAKRIGQEEFYDVHKFDRDKLRELNLSPLLFNSDSTIESHYRFRFAQTYKNSICKIDKGFFDIEVDSKWAAGEFVEMGECAINCVSFMDEKSDTSYTFILRDDRNPLIEKFENKIRTGEFGFTEIHNFVVNAVGGINKAKKFKLMNTKFKLKFYDHEIDLIRDLFFTIHSCSPDFVEGWNSSAFDLEYIIERVKVLGYDPADILCDQRFPAKIVKNYIDARHINELAERGDYTFITGLPVFIDQMIQYGSRRKSKIGSIKGTKLDDIGELEAGVRKLDYSHITQFIEELPWLDFETFVLYNIMDVMVQKCIETKTQDLEYIFAKCVVNNTQYNKGHRQTVYLINRMANDFYKMGYIIGNNINFKNQKPPKFLGALVHNPDNTSEYCKLTLDGRELWICDNLQDYDFSSLYPSIMNEFNIATNTQIGRIEIPEKVYKHENAYMINGYSRSGEFIENLVTDNIIEFFKRWFNLAGIIDMIHDINEYYSQYNLGSYSDMINPRCPVIPMEKLYYNIPVTFSDDKDPVECPVVFYNERDREKYSYNNILQERNYCR